MYFWKLESPRSSSPRLYVSQFSLPSRWCGEHCIPAGQKGKVKEGLGLLFHKIPLMKNQCHSEGQNFPQPIIITLTIMFYYMNL